MEKEMIPGLYVYERVSPKTSPVLKELLQLSKTVSKSSGFSFVHGNSSLIPQLSLWENLQLSAAHELWEDFVRDSAPTMKALITLVKEPHKKAAVASTWECFLISLLKGILEPTPNLLVDMEEEIFPSFVVKTVKSALMNTSYEKMVYLSSGAPSLWLDCAHHLVKKNGFEFVFEKLDAEKLKRHWAA